jgi:hypothetical protein
MKITYPKKLLFIFNFFLLFFILFYSVSSQTLAQSEQKLYLSFNSTLSMKAGGPYGTAGMDIKSEGFVYLNPQKDGTFSGIGEIYITMIYLNSSNPAISLSPLKGQGSIQGKAKKKGKYLNFWFEHGEIPCKGIMTLKYPHPVGTKKEEFVQNFDPHTLAQRSYDDSFSVFDIELKDGAEKVVDYSSMPQTPQAFSGKTTFYLAGIESWRISIIGEEIDYLQPHIDNPFLKETAGELPISMKFNWKLIVDFSTLGKGISRSYYDGNIFSFTLDPGIIFQHNDLYRCTQKECENSPSLDFTGERINGNVSGNTVQLEWPLYVPLRCVTCVPLRIGNLGEKVYERIFESAEFLFSLSKEKIPLQHGEVINRTKENYLKYKITLTKIK